MTAQHELYDVFGINYSANRRPDPSIARRIRLALGDAKSVLNVGAGTGSYEPSDLEVIAIEPSALMLASRPKASAPCVRGMAEALPFAANAFDAAMAILTIHHWSDPHCGLVEMRRIAKHRLVVLTWDQTVNEQWWLPSVYFPGIREIDRRRVVSVDVIAGILGTVRVEPIPIPHNCEDGFDIAFWRRPDAYLDSKILSSMSNFATLTPEERAKGIDRLARDLANGTWMAQFGELLHQQEMDLGLRLVVHEIVPS